ncbi:MAG: hypothetical protein KTR16_12710 [Acidiferrobacterales bacterium]|nr:hypothetical protein [Acidiferrobacterales bacterium]
MRNFELDEMAKTLADTSTAYSLAKELLLLREKHQKQIEQINLGVEEFKAQYEQAINKLKAEAVREAFAEARIPNGAKAACIGEHSFIIEDGRVCPECYNNGDDEDCEMCNGESINGLSDLKVNIPWTTQKEIFQAFCKCAEEEYANKLERGDL